MKIRSLILFLFIPSLVFSQMLKQSAIVSAGQSLFTFAVESADLNKESLLASPSYFFDSEFGVPAFSYFLKGKVEKLNIVSSDQTAFVMSESTEFLNEDESFDGTESVAKKAQKKITVSNFPLYSLKYQGIVNGHELTLLVVRPWKLVSGKLSLINNIKFSTDDFVRQLSESELVRPAEKKANLLKLNKTLTSTQFDKHQSSSYRIIINKPGVASISVNDILDYDRNSNITNADSRTIRLYNRGTQIPILMYDGGDNRFSDNDYFEFFCEEPLYRYKNPMKDLYVDPYTNENVYFLVFDENLTSENRGSRLAEFSGETRDFIPITSARNLRGRSFRTTKHFEQNGTMELLSRVDTSKLFDNRDHMFWERINLNQKKRFPIVLPGVDGNSTTEAFVSVALHGVTYVDLTKINFEHNVSVKIGTTAKTIALSDMREGVTGWNGQKQNIVKYALPMSDLFDAVNTGLNAQIEIENYDPFFPNAEISRYFHLNWVDVTYSRKYEAYQNLIEFKAPEGQPSNYQFTIDFFSDPNVQIYKKGIGKVVNYNLESYISDSKLGTKSYRVIFQDYVVNTLTTEYVALTEVSKIKPKRIEKVFASVLLDEAKSGTEKKLSLKNADRDESFIIVTSSEFWTPDFATDFNPIKQYAIYREQVLSDRSLTNPELQGRSSQVLVTTVTDIYDEFNNGIKSPYAIKDFLSYAFHNWKKPPLYVLLLGDASSQYYTSADKVTTMMFQTVHWGASASDSWFGMVDGNDIIPDIHIGRIPATGFTDIINYLDKLKVYESKSVKDYSNNSSLFISGNEKNFIRDNDELRMSIDKSFYANNIHILADSATDPYFGQRVDLVRYWNEGQATINFMGHGASGAWNDRGFLDDAKAIKDFGDYRLPFVTSMTCFTGAFNAGSGLVNLSEFFVTEAKKGAIGTLASSSVGWKLNDKYLAQSVYQYLLNPDYQNLTVGEIIDLAKLSYRSRYSDYFTTPFRIPTSMIYQYNLLGDPAVILNFPKQKSVPDKTQTLISGDQNLKVNITSNEISNGTLYVRFADSENRDLLEPPIEIPFTSGTGQIDLPIPASIKNRQSNGYLKYYLNGENKESSGVVRFSYGDILIKKVYAENEPVAEKGKLKFISEIESKSEISTVYFNFSVINPVDKDKFLENNTVVNPILYSGGLQMQKQGEYWITIDSIPSQFVSQQYRINYEVRVKDVNGKQSYITGDYFLQEVPDISVISSVETGLYDNQTIGFYQKDGAKIGAQIYNNSTIDVDKVIVKFYRNGVNETVPPTFNGNQTLLGSAEISLRKNSSGFAYIDIPQNFATGEYINISVNAFADTLNGKREKTYMNNLSWPKQLLFAVFLVNAAADSTVLNANGYSLTFKSTFNTNASLLVSTTNSVVKLNQDLLIPVQMKNEPNKAVSIQPFSVSDIAAFTGSADLTIRTNLQTNILKQSGLYFFETRSQRWTLLNNQKIDTINKSITASINSYGLYQVFEKRDDDGPRVNISVDGRLLVPNNIVKTQSHYAFVIQDANGLSPDPNLFMIEIDGQPIDKTIMNIPDSLSDGNQMVVSFDKTLSLGNHTLKYSFVDASKNVTKVESLNFITSNEESITFHGGFPNPFQTDQIFAFNINGVGADWVKLKIYTVSGKLINSFDSSNPSEIPSFVPQSVQNYIFDAIPNSKSAGLAAKYFEIYWDGTDADGNDVAYGVYYVKLIVRLETGKTIEKIFKSARAPK